MPSETRYRLYRSTLAPLYITVSGEQIIKLEYEPEGIEKFALELEDGVIRCWLDNYFAGRRPLQYPPLQLQGSAFENKIWTALMQIPCGQTLSYGELAKTVGSSPRAVGQACKRNLIPVVIPCHRVIAKQSIGGYEGHTSGHRLDRKQWLLAHETQ